LRVLLDEHYSYTIAEELRQHGVDAVAVQKERPERTSVCAARRTSA